MGRCIIKLNDGNRDWYLEWSTIVDAPVTWGMTLDEMAAYRREQTGTEGMRDWAEVVERLNAKGVSWRDKNGDVYSTIGCNRAGKGETCLTAEQIIAAYCTSHVGPKIKGHEHPGDVMFCDGRGNWEDVT